MRFNLGLNLRLIDLVVEIMSRAKGFPTVQIDLTATDNEMGQALRRMRRGAELSQKEVATSIGVATQQVQKYERNGRITMSRLLLFCKVVDGSVYAMLHDALKKMGVNVQVDASEKTTGS